MNFDTSTNILRYVNDEYHSGLTLRLKSAVGSKFKVVHEIKEIFSLHRENKTIKSANAGKL